MTRTLCGLSFALVAVVVIGCGPTGGKQMRTFPVTGKVTMGGAPVPGATVTFAPVVDGNPSAFARTDTQGVYTLTTYDTGDGAVKGEYKVLVSKSAPGGGGPSEPAHDATGQGGGPSAPSHAGPRGGAAGGDGSLLPEKYASVASTPLIKTVNEEDNTIDLVLD
ncbi:carboxypeptidase-like regulatory domain-containing protein [Planctomycetaceae bacterium SH139]